VGLKGGEMNTDSIIPSKIANTDPVKRIVAIEEEREELKKQISDATVEVNDLTKEIGHIRLQLDKLSANFETISEADEKEEEEINKVAKELAVTFIIYKNYKDEVRAKRRQIRSWAGQYKSLRGGSHG